MRVRAVVAYDGTDYGGFQRQSNAPTIQAALEAALAQVTGESVTIAAAGRTDAGVHALGQVIAFDTSWQHEIGALQRALNATLPADVAVREVAVAPPEFHPRYAARSRCYRYTVYNAPVRDPLLRRYSLHVPDVLDAAAMQAASRLLLGEHDFATFGQPPQGDITVRRVLAVDWSGQPPTLHFDIEANAFLYRMVRSIVGTMLQVGRGNMSAEGFAAVLAAADRDHAGPTVSPQGLCLMAVRY
jgi:tRNA pseudouridine38-40 synthase